MIAKRYISAYQQHLIRDHIASASQMEDISYKQEEDAWSIEEDEATISGKTWMDNFDMAQFLENILVPHDKVFWKD